MSEIYFAPVGCRPVLLLDWELADVAAKIESEDDARDFDKYLKLARDGVGLIDPIADAKDFTRYIDQNPNVFTADKAEAAVKIVKKHGRRSDNGDTALRTLAGSAWDGLTQPLRQALQSVNVKPAGD